MLPASTDWLPSFFAPRRRPAESRPLRELPPAFLCAMTRYSFDSSALLFGRFGGRLLSRRLFGGGFRFAGGLFRLGLRRRRLGRRVLGLELRLGLGLLQLGLLAAGQDVGDAHHRQQLAVALLAPVIVAALLLEDDDL